MSAEGFLEKLLDGAEVIWKPLGDIAQYSTTRIGSDQLNESNYVGVDNLLQNRAGRVDSNYVPTSGNLTEFKEGDVLIGNIRPYLRKIWHADRRGGTNGDVLVVHPTDSVLNSRYLFQILTDENFFEYNIQHSKGAKMPRGSKPHILQYLVPIPCPDDPEKSLAIQGEIVRILDKFTELTAELTAELTQRKKQYNHYREQLLTAGNDKSVATTVGNILDMRAGKHIKAAQIEDSQSEDHPYPCFGGNGLRGFVADFSHSGKHVLIGRQGALCGNVKRTDGEYYATEHAVVCIPAVSVDIDWVFHKLTFMNLNQYKSKSAQPGLTVGKIAELPITLPPLEEQKRIASILDSFDTLTTSLTEGLPREIELREKQYAFYRDQLLSFPKPDAEAA